MKMLFSEKAFIMYIFPHTQSKTHGMLYICTTAFSALYLGLKTTLYIRPYTTRIRIFVQAFVRVCVSRELACTLFHPNRHGYYILPIPRFTLSLIFHTFICLSVLVKGRGVGYTSNPVNQRYPSMSLHRFIFRLPQQHSTAWRCSSHTIHWRQSITWDQALMVSRHWCRYAQLNRFLHRRHHDNINIINHSAVISYANTAAVRCHQAMLNSDYGPHDLRNEIDTLLFAAGVDRVQVYSGLNFSYSILVFQITGSIVVTR